MGFEDEISLSPSDVELETSPLKLFALPKQNITASRSSLPNSEIDLEVKNTQITKLNFNQHFKPKYFHSKQPDSKQPHSKHSNTDLINYLPRELLLKIFTHLDIASKCNSASVCRAWNILANDGENWREINLFKYREPAASRMNNSTLIKILASRSNHFLTTLNLKGCSHITDSSMAVIINRCGGNLVSINISRCTSLTYDTLDKICTAKVNGFLPKFRVFEATDITNFSDLILARLCKVVKFTKLDLSWTRASKWTMLALSVKFQNELEVLKLAGCKIDEDNLTNSEHQGSRKYKHKRHKTQKC